ncbi:MAG: hypothetical protein RBS07_10955 [Lentimicrobium sp.]|nr:hypothetical protein [Lentimicrobium sp.]
MRKGLIICILITLSISVSGYVYYQHNYVKTLMLSEIVGKTDNPLINIAIKLGDFDTGLTRHDIKQLIENKDYWLRRIKEVEAISDPTTKEHASYMLLDEMMEDPVLKKICSGILNLGSDVSLGLIEMIL